MISKRLVKAICWQAAFCVLLYFGLARGIEGAMNIAIFLTWLFSVAYFVCSLTPEGDATLRLCSGWEKTIFGWLELAYALTLIWFGYWVTGGVFFVATLLRFAITSDTSGSAEKSPKEPRPANNAGPD